MKGFFDKIKQAAAAGKTEIEEKVADKLMGVESSSSLREHKGVPLKDNREKKQ